MADKQTLNCHRCGDQIGAGEPLGILRSNPRNQIGWRHRVEHQHCEPCYRRLFPIYHSRVGEKLAAADCGGCGRTVIDSESFLVRRIKTHNRAVYCTRECRDQHYRQKSLRPKQQSDCEHCGETYTQRRSDSRFCSTRCRVANHRSVA